MIECHIDEISLSYAERNIISNLTFHTDSKLFLGIAGASGIGKSSLLKLLASVSHAHVSGSVIWYEDKKIIQSPRPIGLVQQGSPIPPWLTVNDFLQMSAGNRYSTLEKNAYILEQYQLDPNIVMHLFPHELSGGMRAKVALAGSMNSGAQVLLFDEPFSGIDEITRHELIDLLKNKLFESGQICFIVSHVIFELMYLCDKVLFLKNPQAGIYVEKQGLRGKVDSVKELFCGQYAEYIYELIETLRR